MRDYIIMTDSCCDLTDHMAKELELTVVPLTVHIDGHDYPNLLDGSAISFEDFYGKIRSGVLATTSAANVGQFQDAMRPVLESGKDIVCISFSSALSTTYQSASIAANDMRQEFPDANIYVVDSLSASLGQGLLLYLAVQKTAPAGYGKTEPFLVSLPYLYEGEYQYDVASQPKTDLEREVPTKPTSPATNPTFPGGKKLPQTGQLWWPVPVLACGGLGCIVVGLFRRRRAGDED